MGGYERRWVVRGNMPPWNLEVYLYGKDAPKPGHLTWKLFDELSVPNFETPQAAAAWARGLGAQDFTPVERTVVVR